MASLLDNFNRANETPLNNGSTWKGPIFSGDPQLLLSGNRASAAGSSVWSDSYWNTKFPANQVAQVEVAAKVASRTIELGCRIQNPGNATSLNLYYVAVSTSTGAWELWSVKAGSESNLGTATKAIAVGDKLRIEAEGTTIRCIHETSAGVKTTVIEKTSSTVTGEGYIGVTLLSAGTELAVDNFFGGAIGEEGKAWKLELADTVTATDALVKGSSKALADGATGSDAIAKRMAKPLADSVTGSDALAKLPSKAFSDSASASDALTKQAGKQLADTVAGSDAVSKQPRKSLAENVTGSDSLSKRVAKSLVETLVAVDSIAKLPLKSFVEVVTASDSVVARIIEKILPLAERPTTLELVGPNGTLSITAAQSSLEVMAPRTSLSVEEHTYALEIASGGSDLEPCDPAASLALADPETELELHG